MQEEWTELLEFPGYLVSNLGRVCNAEQNFKICTLFRNQQGIVNVYLSNRSKQYCRSVALMVADNWLKPPIAPHYNTPTHKDGDRSNCRADNLVWRPRWYAIKYHKEVASPPLDIYFDAPLRCEETGEVFRNSREVARAYGLLEHDVIKNLRRPREFFMTPHNFEIV